MIPRTVLSGDLQDSFKMFNIIIIMQEYMNGRWSQAPNEMVDYSTR